MKSLVYIEEKNGRALPASLEALGAAQRLGTAEAVVLGSRETAQTAANYGAAVTRLLLEDSCPDQQVAALEQIIREKAPELVLLAATQLGKDLAPRLAQRFDAGCVTDATALEQGEQGVTFTRPAYGGSILEHLTAEGPLCFATLRGGSFDKPEQTTSAAIAEKTPDLPPDAVRAQVTQAVCEIAETVDLEGAEVIVAGGRGVGDAQTFQLVEELAALLGGVVGASRPAIEAGWVDRSHQIGQSGKIVAPKLYIACGISGAMQHLSGVLGAKYIVAINKDEEASIFGAADLGIVGDVREVLPLMIEAIRTRQQS